MVNVQSRPGTKLRRRKFDAAMAIEFQPMSFLSGLAGFPANHRQAAVSE